jgi:uncharacterized protein (TIGR03083 family)
MESTRLRALLESEFRLLHSAVAATDADAPVPDCPGWTVAELAGHVAELYRHKAACIRLGEFPRPWPPQRPDVTPAEDLDSAYAELAEQLDSHQPSDHAATWHGPDQTVGFWIRRMAQETVIHRVDAERAAGRDVSVIAEDLALDGIDEILVLFFGYGSRLWRDECGDLLEAPDERPIGIAAGDGHWSISATPKGVEVSEGAAEAAAASVAGAPAPLLLWLWNRVDDDAVTLSGDEALLGQFHALRTALTQ